MVYVSLPNCSSNLLIYLYLEPTRFYFISSHFTFLKYLFASLIANISANLPLDMCFYISYDRGPYVQWEFGVLRDPPSSSCGGLKPFYPIMLFWRYLNLRAYILIYLYIYQGSIYFRLFPKWTKLCFPKFRDYTGNRNSGCAIGLLKANKAFVL